MAAYGQGQSEVGLAQVKMASKDTEDATKLSRSFLTGNSFYVTIGLLTVLEVVLAVYLLRSALS